jgi:magnesium transporter
MGEWIDLVDPDEAELTRRFGQALHPRAIDRLLQPAQHEDEPRPTIERQGDYVFGVVLVAVAIPEEDRVFYQEIDIVLTHDLVLTVRKTPPGEQPYDTSDVHAACAADGDDSRPGMVLYRLVDDIAERYLDLIDSMNDEIDDLEDHVEIWSPALVRERISGLRHDLLHVRRTLAPTRDAVRRVVDGRIDTEGKELFTAELALHFGDAYDKLLRASDGLELSRDLVSGVRDYSQSKIANDQNEVMKRLTAVASILLVPTFIVGLYGQNFRHIPELHWGFGYWWSWGWILATTAFQIVYYRRKGWL